MEARHIARRLCACVCAHSSLTTPSPASTGDPPPHPHTIVDSNACRTQCGARCAAWGACAEGRTGRERKVHTYSVQACVGTRRSLPLAPSRARFCRQNTIPDGFGANCMRQSTKHMHARAYSCEWMDRLKEGMLVCLWSDEDTAPSG